MKKFMFLFFVFVATTTSYSMDGFIKNNCEVISKKNKGPEKKSKVSSSIIITVYGSGGLVSDGETHHVCPNTSKKVCSKVEIDDMVAPNNPTDVFTDVHGVLSVTNGERYNIVIKRIKSYSYNNKKYTCTGSNLAFKLINKINKIN